MNGYWVCYELDNEATATWSNYAFSADEFINDLLSREHNIKRFTELLIDEENGKKVFPPRNISIGHFNRKIKR